MNYQNKIAKGTIPMPSVVDSSLVSARLHFPITTALNTGDIVELGSIPANARIVDMVLDCSALGANAVVSAGVLNSGKSDLDTTASGGAAWFSGQDVSAETAVRASAATLRALTKVASSDQNRPIGIKAGAGCAVGEIALTVFYRQALLA